MTSFAEACRVVLLDRCWLLLVVAAAATYIPARRATKVDPIVALR